MKKQTYDFGVLGGDVRQLAAARRLKKAGYRVLCYAPDENASTQAASLHELILCSKMLVAPLPFCALAHLKTGEDFYRLLAQEGKKGQLLFSGPLPESVKSSLCKSGIRLYNPAADPVFTHDNAKLTAEGVVAELLFQCSSALCNSHILLIGYGNCGRAIAGVLSGFSAKITVCDTDNSVLEKISSGAAPHTPAPLSILLPEELPEKLSDFHFVINTAPCLIFDRKLLQKAAKETLFLDIASAPGGIDLQAASELNMTAKQLPGLPAKVSPEDAGIFYAEAILRKLHESANNAISAAVKTLSTSASSAPASSAPAPSASAPSVAAPPSESLLFHAGTPNSHTPRLSGRTIGIALTGSFCTYSKIWKELETLKNEGAELIFILSHNAATIESRFGKPEEYLTQLQKLTDKPPIFTIEDAEPIGPGSLLDALVIFPCTGNTAAKLSCGITDTPVLMAAKAHLRNEKPLLLSLSTNDALGMNMKNIGLLLNTRHLYFVPFGQDDPVKKPNSMTAHTELLLPALEAALSGRQLQPVILSHETKQAVSALPAETGRMPVGCPLLSAAANTPSPLSKVAKGGDHTCAQ